MKRLIILALIMASLLIASARILSNTDPKVDSGTEKESAEMAYPS